MTLRRRDPARWGAGDQLGAGVHPGPKTTPGALREVGEGRLLDLPQTVETDAPRMSADRTPHVVSMSATARNTRARRRALGAETKAGVNIERVGMTTHVGTHIDAPGRFSLGDRLYDGREAEATLGPLRGLPEPGAEHDPARVARRLFIDLAGRDGGPHPGAARPIGAADPGRWPEAAGLVPGPRDAILLGAGWGRLQTQDPARCAAGEPGRDLERARRLTERGTGGIGAGAIAVEALPGVHHPRAMMPVHQHRLAEAEAYLIESPALEEEAKAGRASLRLIAAAPKFRGATGAPPRPLALL